MHVGFLGAGNITETHMKAAASIDELELVAVGGQNPQRVKDLAREFGCAGYTSEARFWDHLPMDIVAIGSPSGIHARQGVEAAKRGIHVLVEKPIDVSLEEADHLISVCEEKAVQLGIFFQDRVNPDFMSLKEVIDSGELGRLLVVSAQVKWFRPADYYSDSRWRGTWQYDGGGALINQAIHTVDLLLWLLGSVRKASSLTATQFHEIEVEDTLVAILEFGSGALATLEATTCAHPGFPRRVVISGSKGTAVIEDDTVVSLQFTDESEQAHSTTERGEAHNRSEASPVVSDVRGHRNIFQNFLHGLRGRETLACDGEEGRRSLELVQRLYESAR